MAEAETNQVVGAVAPRLCVANRLTTLRPLFSCVQGLSLPRTAVVYTRHLARASRVSANVLHSYVCGIVSRDVTWICHSNPFTRLSTSKPHATATRTLHVASAHHTRSASFSSSTTASDAAVSHTSRAVIASRVCCHTHSAPGLSSHIEARHNASPRSESYRSAVSHRIVVCRFTALRTAAHCIAAHYIGAHRATHRVTLYSTAYSLVLCRTQPSASHLIKSHRTAVPCLTRCRLPSHFIAPHRLA
jgi:hypothetical protein